MNKELLLILKKICDVLTYVLIYLGTVGGLISLFGKSTGVYYMLSFLGIVLIAKLMTIFGFKI